MLYVLFTDGRATAAQTAYPKMADGRYQTRNDWPTMARAEEVAAQLTEATGTLYLATDSGPNVSPRFDVIEAPKVGDAVSGRFNGDSYPEGTIVNISKSFRRIATSTGKAFYRRGQSGSWISEGTWGLTPGHVSARNPEF